MKVVLRQDVEHLGDRGEVVNVAEGYARNYLLPKRLALKATPGNLKNIDSQKRVWAAREARDVDAAQAVADRIAALDLTIKKKAGESETLYGSVTASEIAELLEAKGVEIDRRKIVMDEPIKTLGEFTVGVRLHKSVIGEVKLKVEAEEG
jgi:large subunit ribosomal protein L9